MRSSIAHIGTLLLAIAVGISMPISATGTCVMSLLGDVASAEACSQVCTMAGCPMQGRKMAHAVAQTNDPECCQISGGATPAASRLLTSAHSLPESAVDIVPMTRALEIRSSSVPLHSLDPALDPQPPRAA